MYNVIIVDHEFAVREGLKDYFKNNFDSFEICNEFDDGERALEYIRENPDKVDVVITDIIMPNRTGIDLAREIHQQSTDTIVVFLSGFRDFEYAKQAIKYNVFAYMEKPVDFFELDEVFEDIKKHLRKKKKSENNDILEEKKLLITQLLVEIYSGFFNSYEQLIAHVKRLGFNELVIKRPCAKFTVEIKNKNSDWKYGTEGQEVAIQNAFRFKNIKIFNIFSSNGSMDMLAVSGDFFSNDTDDGFRENIQRILEEGALALKEIDIDVDITDIGFFDDLYSLNTSSRDLIGKKSDKLKNALNMELLSGSFDEINENCNITIKKSLRWIAENYNKNITLSDAANYVMLSPVYYGRLFKLNVGISFTNYLLDYRLDKARRLLTETMHNVREISILVGYKDANYFIRLFKKKYGISPNEFKKKKLAE